MDSINPDIILSGAFSTKQLKENLKAKQFQLTADELSALEKLKIKSKDYWQERSELEWR